MAKVAVILAGCGVYDGAEINEAVLTLLHLAKADAQVQCFAPDQDQFHTINHMTGEEMPETRNVMVEASRITRGDIQPLTALNADEFDALIVPVVASISGWLLLPQYYLLIAIIFCVIYK